MTLSAPTKLIFLISLVLAIIGFLPMIGVAVPVIGAYWAWLLVAAYVLLAAGVVLKGV